MPLTDLNGVDTILETPWCITIAVISSANSSLSNGSNKRTIQNYKIKQTGSSYKCKMTNKPKTEQYMQTLEKLKQYFVVYMT